MTFSITGGADGVVFLGMSDLHDPRWDDMKQVIHVDQIGGPSSSSSSMMINDTEHQQLCHYSALVYPSQTWARQYYSDSPIVYAVLVVTCFLITTILFAMYDFAVQQRQRKVMETAEKTNAIVTSLFPSNVRDRLMEELKPDHEDTKMMKSSRKSTTMESSSILLNASTIASKSGTRLSNASSHGLQSDKDAVFATSENIFGSKPIADLFPNT